MTTDTSPATDLLPWVRGDRLPEGKLFTRYYSDRGCSAAPSCLDCPLLPCLEDMPPRFRQAERDAKIRIAKSQGVHAQKLGKKYKLSARTIHRIVQKGRN